MTYHDERPASSERQSMRSEWKPAEEALPKDCVGYSILKGRMRPSGFSAIFDQPITSLWRINERKGVARELQAGGITTIGDLSRLQPDQFSQIPAADEVQRRLERCVGLTNHARLLEFVFQGEEQTAIRADNEAELMDVVENALSVLLPQEREFMIDRFGLGNGVMQTSKEISTRLGISNTRVNKVIRSAARKLRYLESSHKLWDYFSVSEDSFGHDLFPDAVFYKDLPELSDVIPKLGLPQYVEQELRAKGLYAASTGYHHFIGYFTIRQLMRADLHLKELSAVTRAVVNEALEVKCRVFGFERSKVGTVRKPEDSPAPRVNNLFSGKLSSEEFHGVEGEPLNLTVTMRNLLQRAGIRVVDAGDLLNVTIERLLSVSRLQEGRAREIAGVLETLFEAKFPGKFQKGEIFRLFSETIKTRKKSRP